MKKGLLRFNLDAGDGRVSVKFMKGPESAASFDIKRVNSIDYPLKSPVKGTVALKIHLHNARLYTLEVQ